MAKAKRQVIVKLVFDEDDLNMFRAYATFCDCVPGEVKDMSNAEFGRFKKEIQDTTDNFKFEIMDGSRDACANDWLDGWGADRDECECYND